MATIGAAAQYSGPGFYRVQNASTHSYICIKGTKFQKSTYPDAFWSCVLMQKDSAQVTDPGSIIYIPGTEDTSLYGQGVDTYSLTKLWLNIEDALVMEEGKPSYIATTEYYDPQLDKTIRCIFRDRGNGFTAGTIEKTESRWWIEPVNEESIEFSYFGVKPTSEAIKDADGYYWTSLCCDFPVMIPVGGGVEGAYTIEAVVLLNDGKHYAAPLKLYGQGETVPAATPVLLKCSSPYASGNKLIPTGDIANNTTFPVCNKYMLGGNYFSTFTNFANLNDPSVTTVYTPEQATKAEQSFLVLSVDDQGKVCFKPQEDGNYMAANTAWLNTASMGMAGETVYLGIPPEPEPEVISGDIDGDGRVSIADVSGLIDIVLDIAKEGAPKSADVNGDGIVNIRDVADLIDILVGFF